MTPTTRPWWIEPASTGDASCCAPSAGRCPETCWLAAPLLPLEAELGIQLAEHGDVNLDLPAVSEDVDAGIDDVLERFIRQMYKMEGRLSLVGYSMLSNQWMLDWGLPGTSTSAAG